MFDFEATMKLIVAIGTAGFVFVMIGIGVKVIFFRKKALGQGDTEALEGLEDRLHRTEAKLGELEERLDFAERMLTEVRTKALPGKP